MKIKFETYDQVALNSYPVQPIKKNVPDWYKNLPIDDFIVKNCIPVLDYLTSGYLISYTADFELEEVYNEFNYFDPMVMIDPSPDGPGIKVHSQLPIGGHLHSQCPVHMNGKKNNYIKMTNPWKIVTPPGYSCLFYQPFYELNDDYTLFPAIVDTDVFEYPVNFPGVLKKPKVSIKAGDPMMLVFPYKRESWEMEVSEYDPGDEMPIAGNGNYKNNIWKPKDFK